MRFSLYFLLFLCILSLEFSSTLKADLPSEYEAEIELDGALPKVTNTRVRSLRQNQESMDKSASDMGAQTIYARKAIVPTIEGLVDEAIKSGDMIRFSLENDPALNAIVQVSSTGMISLPWIGSLALAGLSLQKAQDAVAAAYADGYFVKPRVHLMRIDAVPQE